MELFFKILLIIPLILSIKAALTLKNELNTKRAIDFMLIGALIFATGELTVQEGLAFEVLGLGVFLYGLGIVVYYKFKEGLYDE
ncbi:MAG: hypothetical protein GX295_08965 [Syntrophomonadaceae bacterium]|nr:hypothetical protein [Syntrophomonadaceae bacterium]